MESACLTSSQRCQVAGPRTTLQVARVPKPKLHERWASSLAPCSQHPDTGRPLLLPYSFTLKYFGARERAAKTHLMSPGEGRKHFPMTCVMARFLLNMKTEATLLRTAVRDFTGTHSLISDAAKHRPAWNLPFLRVGSTNL